jgi:hypothetical protein
VIFHRSLHEGQYIGIEDRFTFAKVGDKDLSIHSEKIRDRVLMISELSGYLPMGKHWAESEFIFALHRTPDAIKSDWLGFLQYDNSVISKDGVIVDELDRTIESFEKNTVVCFVPIDTRYEMDYNHIAMDFSDPKKIIGHPRCYFPMIADYNKFYGTKHTYSDLLSHKTLALCSAFMMHRDRFMEMMRFCEWVTDKNNLDQFDPDRKHRMAGGYMERYYATWIALSGSSLHTLQVGQLDHL